MNDIETQVLRLIGENITSPDVFTDDDIGMRPIRDSLNEAAQEIVMLTGGYTEQVYIPLRKDVTHYRMGFERGHFGWIKHAWMMDVKRPLEHVSVAELEALDTRWLDRNGPPRCFFQVGLDLVGIYPRPPSQTDVVQLTMVVIPADYTTSDERIKVQAQFEDALINYAVAEYWASRGDADSAKNHFSLYVETLGIRLGYEVTADRDHTRARSEPPAAVSARP